MQSLLGSYQSRDPWLGYLRSHSSDQAVSASLEEKYFSSLHSQRLFRQDTFHFGFGITQSEELQILSLHPQAIHSYDAAYLQGVPLNLLSLQALYSSNLIRWMR